MTLLEDKSAVSRKCSCMLWWVAWKREFFYPPLPTSFSPHPHVNSIGWLIISWSIDFRSWLFVLIVWLGLQRSHWWISFWAIILSTVFSQPSITDCLLPQMKLRSQTVKLSQLLPFPSAENTQSFMGLKLGLLLSKTVSCLTKPSLGMRLNLITLPRLLFLSRYCLVLMLLHFVIFVNRDQPSVAQLVSPVIQDTLSLLFLIPSFWKKCHWFSMAVLAPAAGNRHKLICFPFPSPVHQYANCWNPNQDTFPAGKPLFSFHSKKVYNFFVAKMIFLSLLLCVSLLWCSLWLLLGSTFFSLLSTAPGLVTLNKYYALCC